MHKIQYCANIVSNRKICQKFYHLSFKGGPLAGSVAPGQFIHIRVTDGLKPFFRRPFSVFRAKNNVEILYEVVGQGTEILASKKKGEKLDVIGPLGNGFTLPGNDVEHVVMIAGGVGIAPFLMLSDKLKKRKIERTLLFGARSKGHVFSMKPFKNNGCRVLISTNDGSVGAKGYVSKFFSKIKTASKKTMIYACGPRPMLASVQAYAHQKGLPCEASLEEVMACGLGACLGCAVQTTSGYKTVCHDGPVFNLNEIIY